MFLLLKLKYLRNTVILTLESMEIGKRSNLEHHVTEAATLAMTTVRFTINRFFIRIISGASVLE